MATDITVVKDKINENKKNKKQSIIWFEPYLFILLDAFAIIVSFIAVMFVFGKYPSINFKIHVYILIIAAFPLSTFVVAKLMGLYRFKLNVSSVQELPKVIQAAGLAVLVIMACDLLITSNPAETNYFLVLWPTAAFFIFIFRVFGRTARGYRRVKGIGLKNVLIVGCGSVGNDIAKKLKENPHLGLKPIGFVDSDPPSIEDERQLDILGAEKDLSKLIKDYKIDHVILSFSSQQPEKTIKTIRENQDEGVLFSIVPRLFEAVSDFDLMDAIQSVPLINLKNIKQSSIKHRIKRLIDIAGSLIAIIVFAPFFLVIAIFIKLDSKGPVFYKQERIGKNGKRFQMLKFRSMVNNAQAVQDELLKSNEATGPIFKIRNDPRTTMTGKFLRRYSLDEAPQFFNVLKGDMSLVGPRPPIPEEVEHYNEWHRQRLSAIPGITGLWQINGRSDLSFEEMVKLDVLYIRNWSLWLDIVLLLRTVPTVINRRGAY